MHAWLMSSDATAAGLGSDVASWCAVVWCDSFRAESFRGLFRMEKHSWKPLYRA
jgi:hypothetical protein